MRDQSKQLRHQKIKHGPNNGKAAIDDIKESGIIEKCPANKKLCKGFVE